MGIDPKFLCIHGIDIRTRTCKQCCPNCDGTGRVHSHNDECWQCKGTGLAKQGE